MHPLEKKLLKNGFEFVIGCDEVGRGALAGPVVAAAVVLPVTFFTSRLRQLWIKEVADSKELTSLTRERLEQLILSESVAYGIGQVEAGIIDSLNIHHATLSAMHVAISKVHTQLEMKKDSRVTTKAVVVVDGKFTVPGVPFKQHAIVNGDATVLSIAAASIVAKVYRDALMKELAKQLPHYGFDRHKGYGTKLHQVCLQHYGMSPEHRRTFCQKFVGQIQ